MTLYFWKGKNPPTTRPKLRANFWELCTTLLFSHGDSMVSWPTVPASWSLGVMFSWICLILVCFIKVKLSHPAFCETWWFNKRVCPLSFGGIYLPGKKNGCPLDSAISPYTRIVCFFCQFQVSAAIRTLNNIQIHRT